MEELGKPRKRAPFDTNVDIRAHRVAVANAFNELGWDASGLIDEDMLEYYVLHRRLRFERFKVELREHLLDTLNESLARAGDEIGSSGRLTLEGVPSLSDVDAAESHLAAGDIPFKDLIEPFTPY